MFPKFESTPASSLNWRICCLKLATAARTSLTLESALGSITVEEVSASAASSMTCSTNALRESKSSKDRSTFM
ncbi:hypothetical protein Hanom_Chr09g00826341 [Helianthus anomalus]